MFGYLWMKGRYEPEQGMVLHPSSVRVMLLWLMLGFTGLFPMANGAHVAGLVVGHAVRPGAVLTRPRRGVDRPPAYLEP